MHLWSKKKKSIHVATIWFVFLQHFFLLLLIWFFFSFSVFPFCLLLWLFSIVIKSSSNDDDDWNRFKIQCHFWLTKSEKKWKQYKSVWNINGDDMYNNNNNVSIVCVLHIFMFYDTFIFIIIGIDLFERHYHHHFWSISIKIDDDHHHQSMCTDAIAIFKCIRFLCYFINIEWKMKRNYWDDRKKIAFFSTIFSHFVHFFWTDKSCFRSPVLFIYLSLNSSLNPCVQFKEFKFFRCFVCHYCWHFLFFFAILLYLFILDLMKSILFFVLNPFFFCMKQLFFSCD